MKSRMPMPAEYRQQIRRDRDEEIQKYFLSAQGEISKRLCYAAILVLDDCFRDLFGDTEEEIEKNYQRFALCLGETFHGYARDCYKWAHSQDNEAVSKAMAAELRERGIEVTFE